MSVHYKFKSTLDFDTVSFDGLHISVADLKKAIFHQKRIGKNTDFDLQITNAQTKEDYTDDNALIAKNTSLIVARVPLTVQQKRNWDKTETPAFNVTKDEATLGKAVDLTRLDGSEEDKIRAMMTQSTQDYDPSKYMKIRGSNQTGEVPPNYRCYKCHQPGHWIKNCPLSTNQEPIEIKKSTGIPRSFMVPVEGPSVPGAMMTPGGTYAVPAIDHQAYKEGKKEKPPFAHNPEPVVEKPEIPEDLLCNICKDLLIDAVMIPCCGNSFCDECIRTFLLESEEHECPDCNEKDVSPESLIPNRYLRNAVLNFKNETGYVKRPTYKPPFTLAPPKPTAPLIAEPTISEKLTASQTMSAATPAQTVGGTGAARTENEAKEADKPNESAHEPDVATTDIVTKLNPDEEEAPPPPGTEPPLLPKHPSDQSWHDRESSSELRDDDYARDRYSRERRRSFSRENHRDSRMDNNGIRPAGRRRSLSPRNSDFPMHPATGPKAYQGHMTGDNRYHPPSMHYDPNLRRSTEDRAGTPTVDEPHLHPPSHGQPPLLGYPPGDDRGVPPTPGYSGPPPPGPPPPPAGHQPGLLPDPYMQPRMPMYPPHQQPAPPPPAGHGYPPPPPPQRYDAGRPPYQPPGYRPGQPPRTFSGLPRPLRGMHGIGYRGMQPPPPGMGRNLHNGTAVGLDDPLAAFERMLREKDERDRRLGKHRRRTRSRSRSRSYSRSRSRSFGRRGSPSRASRSRSPPPKRRAGTRSPPPSSHRTRSRTPKKRRSRSRSFSISRSRSYSRSQSPRGSLPRDRDRDRKGKRREATAYRSPARSPPRYHKERERERERRRSREPYGSYYNDTAAPAPGHDYGSSYREPRPDRAPRYPPSHVPPGVPPPPASSLLPPPGMIVPPTGPPAGPVPPASVVPTSQPPPPMDRKDYYDSYNRYPGAPGQPPARYAKRFDDVAPPGTEGYYDLPPPGIDHLERPAKERTSPKEKEADRYKNDRDRHRDDKSRTRSDRDRRDGDYDYHKDQRHDRYDHRSADRKRGKRSSSPYAGSSKYRGETKDSSPERQSRGSKRDKDHEDKADDRKKEKKMKEKKKKKDSEEKEKKKKKKKEKKQALIMKEKEAAAAAAAATNTQPATTANPALVAKVRVKEEPQSDGETAEKTQQPPAKPNANPPEAEGSTAPLPEPGNVVVKTEPPDEPAQDKLEPATQPPETKSGERSPTKQPEAEKQEQPKPDENAGQEGLYTGVIDETELKTAAPVTPAPVAKQDAPETNNKPNEPEDEEDEKPESPKREEFLAPLPELSKWERDESAEKLDDSANTPEKEPPEPEDSKSNKIQVTTEVLKRAENAIFQKAINAIRPIEIKKISDSRKVLYQNPEPKVLEQEIDASRKNVNVTITVDKNQRNVELSSEPLKKTTKIERAKIKAALQLSPSRPSVKERLGDKIEDEAKLANLKCVVEQRRTEVKSDGKTGKPTPRIIKDRKISLSIDDAPIIPNPERKVFVEDRKRDRSRIDNRIVEDSLRMRERSNSRKNERVTRTPPLSAFKPQPVPAAAQPSSLAPQRAKDKDKEEDDDSKDERKRDKKSRDDGKKRKKEHHSRSKSRERKRRKDKKHKRERARSTEQRRSQKLKDKDASIATGKDKTTTAQQPDGEKEKDAEDPSANSKPNTAEPGRRRQRRNPRLSSDRKRSILDEDNFEPDYSASDSESEEDDRATLVATKRAKTDDSTATDPDNDPNKPTSKKRPKIRQPSSSEDEDSSSTESSSSESDSSVESHRKKKRKHKKRKKRKASRRNESSSDSDAYTDSSDSSSEEEKHRKKKKSKSKSKQSKKKKKSKHK